MKLKNKILIFILLITTLIATNTDVFMNKAYAAGANLALKKEAFASSMYNESGNYAPEKINDGNYGTLWSDGAVKYTGPVAGYYYIAVDLADSYIINQIIAYPRIDFDDSDMLHNWYIQLSNTRDFSDAITVAHIESKCEFGGNFVFDVDLEGSYRYVRIASPKAYFTCGELEVFGEKYDPETMSGKNNFVDAQDKTYNGAAAICDALGIINATGKANFEGEKMFTRAAAVKSVATMMNYMQNKNEKSIFSDVPEDYWAKDYINAAYTNGIISKSDKFRPDEYITQGELLKMVTYAFGYGENVQRYGDWRIGTQAVADDLDLLRNVKDSFDEKLNRGTAAQIIYNALKTPMNKLTYQDNNMPVLKPSDNNALYDLFDMKIVEGIMTQNSASTLTHPTDKSEGRVVINDELYEDSDGLLQRMLGKRVGILVEAEDSNIIIAGYEDTTINKITRVDSSSFISASNGVCTYDNAGNNKNIKFTENDVYVIRNYGAVPDWTYADLNPTDGYVEYIDNNKDGEIDVISILKPDIMIGGYVLPTDGNINIIGNDGSKITVLKPTWTRFMRNGKITTPGKYMSNDVIFVYKSDNDAILFVNGGGNSKTGMVESISARDAVIDSSVYELSDYYKNLQDEDLKLKAGEENTVLLDDKNRIICVASGNVNADADIFGFVCNEFVDENEDIGYLNIFTSNADFGFYNFAESVIVNETREKSDSIATKIKNGQLNLKNKMVRFRLNQQGKISNIEMLENSGIVLGTNVVYINNGQGVYNKGWLVQPLMPDTICFTIPKSGTNYVYKGYEKQFAVDTVSKHMSELDQIQEKWDFYDVDDLGYPKVAVRYKEIISASGQEEIRAVKSTGDVSGLIVKNVFMYSNEDGEISYGIDGLDMNGNQKTINLDSTISRIFRADDIQGEHTDWLNDDKDIVIERLTADDIAAYTIPVSDLSVGDLIRVEMGDGRAVAIERTFDAYSGKNGIYQRPDDGTYYSAGELYPAYPDAEYRLVYGLAKEIKQDTFIMSTCERNVGEGALTQYVPYNKLERLIICDEKNFEIYGGSDLPAYFGVDQEVLLFTTDRAKPTCLIIYK